MPCADKRTVHSPALHMVCRSTPGPEQPQQQQQDERCIQIWERQDSGLLSLHATAEPAAALLPLLAWQPNGRHLFTVHTPSSGPQAPGAGGWLAAGP